jgi:hypothetical protein
LQASQEVIGHDPMIRIGWNWQNLRGKSLPGAHGSVLISGARHLCRFIVQFNQGIEAG